MPYMAFNRRGFKESEVRYWSLRIMNQKLLFRYKNVISIKMYLFQKPMFLYVILLCGKKFVNILWLCVPRTLFSGQNSDAISAVVLTLGVNVVLFSFEGADISETDPLS